MKYRGTISARTAHPEHIAADTSPATPRQHHGHATVRPPGALATELRNEPEHQTKLAARRDCPSHAPCSHQVAGTVPLPITPLKRQVLLPLLLTVAALLLVIVWGVAGLFERQLSDQVAARARLVAGMVNNAAESTPHPGELQRIVSSLGADAGLQDIIVVRGRPPRVIASTQIVWLNSLLSEIPAGERVDDLERVLATGKPHTDFNPQAQVIEYSEPLQPGQADQLEGAITVRLDTRPIAHTMLMTTFTMVGVFVTALGVIIALGYALLRHRVIRPLHVINSLISEHAAADDPRWDEGMTPNEIGALARTLRTSTSRADAAIKALEQQKDALADSEERYRLIAALSSDIISRFSVDGTLSYVSPACSTVLGYDPGDMLAKSWLEWIHPDDQAMARYTFRSMGTAYQVDTLTCRMQHADGQYRWMETSIRGVRVEAADEMQIVGITRNVSRRKAAETALRDQAEHTRAILNTMLDGIVTIDRNGVIDSINPGISRIFGYTSEELLGQNVKILMPDPHREQHDTYLHDYQTTRVPRIIGVGREVEGQRRDGSVFPMELVVTEISREGRAMYVGMIRDISERKRVERMKSEFVSAVSHEIRTPMNSILGFVQLLSYDDNLDERQKMNLTKVRKAGDHLLNIIDDVLDLSRIEAGKITLSIEPVSVAHVLTECRNLTQSQADARHVCLHADADSVGDLYVRADRTRLRQVLINLISNAVKYNRNGGAVWVTAVAEGSSRVRIDVRDNGRGIAPEKIERLYQPFNRLGAERGEIEGTGIGLAITKHLVDLMSGAIKVTSQPNVGSTFSVEFGRCSNDAGASSLDPVPEAPRDASVRHGNFRVLYVEDNPANFQFVHAVQKKFWPDMTLLNATTAEAGIELAKSQRPDVILMDINLPGMDGFDALASLRADPTLRHVPVIAVTANAMRENIERAQTAGFNAYVTKPVDVPAFVAIMDNALAQRTSPQGAHQTTPPPAPTPEVNTALAPNVVAQLTTLLGARIAEIVDSLLDDLPRRLKLMEDAIARNDQTAIRTEAHTIKGSCGNLGALHFAELCTEVSTACKTGNMSRLPELHAAMLREFNEHLVPALRQLRQDVLNTNAA